MSMASKKKKNIILVGAILLLLAGSGTLLWFRNIKNGCLSDNEESSYEIKRKGLADDVAVYVKDKKTNIQKNSFVINDIFDGGITVEKKNCGVYVMRMFNYNPNTTKQPPGYRDELWKYDYKNRGKKIVLLAEKTPISGYFRDPYSPDFRIDPTEKYVALVHRYDTIFIKNLKTLKDDVVLPVSELIADYPNLAGYQIDFEGWTNDGKYYWGGISDTAYRLALFRIDIKTKKWELFPLPDGAMGGDMLNRERGLITYHIGAPWTADADFDQMYRNQWKKEGKKVPFYVYNVFTKEKTLLTEIDDPTWYFQPKWISDTELEYILPGEVKKVYKIELK